MYLQNVAVITDYNNKCVIYKFLSNLFAIEYSLCILNLLVLKIKTKSPVNNIHSTPLNVRYRSNSYVYVKECF